MVNGEFLVGGGVGTEVGYDVLDLAFEEGDEFALGVRVLVVETAEDSGLGQGDILEDPVFMGAFFVQSGNEPAAVVVDFCFGDEGDSVDIRDLLVH